jgi:glycosyltransferase involved in cell wall biosynthesis
MRRLQTDPVDESEGDGASRRPTLRVHGANLDLQAGAFQNTIRDLLDQTEDTVTFVGRYDPSQISRLMAAVDWVVVPSIWWENSPLVIQEAFAHGRPVICSDIGGMAEKVTDGVDGLHFRAGDADSLAETIAAAVSTPGLWERLREGIREVYAMEDHVRFVCDLYEELAAARKPEVHA